MFTRASKFVHIEQISIAYINLFIYSFRNLTTNLAHIPYAAVRCSLKDLVPIGEASKWDSRATEFLKLVVQK